MTRIIVGNSRSRLVGNRALVMELREETKIRAKNYFWSPAYGRGGWDGYIRYVSEDTGAFPTGLLPQIIDILDKEKIEYTLEDDRKLFKPVREVDQLGEYKLQDEFDYQCKAVKILLNNTLGGIGFPRGIMWAATNSGKNVIAAAIFRSYHDKRKGLFLIDELEIYNQALEELEELLPGEIGRIDSKKIILNRVTVCMVQTLKNRLKKDNRLRAYIAQQDIIIVDECDKTALRKDCTFILNIAVNAPVKVGLTGTAELRFAKNKTRNQALVNIFGPVIFRIKNKELVERGVSTKPIIKIYQGSTREEVYREDYQTQYDEGITDSRQRNKQVWKKVRKYLNRTPILIMVRYHRHIKVLKKLCPTDILENYTVKGVHGKTPNRKEIIAKFKEGRIDILIASKILTRGKNIPLIKVLINAAGGDSETVVLQMLGRSLRKHKTKDEVIVIDFWDRGKYLRRHSFHRVVAYKNEGFKVKELYEK